MVEVPVEFDRIRAKLLDATGRAVFSTTSDPGTTGLFSLNLRHLPVGIYMLHLTDFEGELHETHRINLAK